jgi:hypothetical protein
MRHSVIQELNEERRSRKDKSGLSSATTTKKDKMKRNPIIGPTSSGIAYAQEAVTVMATSHDRTGDGVSVNQYLCLLFVMALILLPVSTSGQETLTITVTTDQQSYSLGQSILMAISVQQFGSPVASVAVFYELRGPQNQVITDGFGITDSTGKYAKQVTVENDFPLGAYTVYVSVSANGQTASATSAFRTIPEFTSGLGPVLLAFLITITMLISCRKWKSTQQSGDKLAQSLKSDKHNQRWQDTHLRLTKAIMRYCST